MNKGLIGIIVPVYKVEKYIAECIDSILAQTYTDFRLILVDDGTPDNAGKICDEYSKSDSRITVIHQENAGVTRARARGVEEADNCEFITFVDGDDMLTQTALEEYISRLTEDDGDIVISSKFQTECGETRDISIHYKFTGTTLGIDEFRRKMISIKGAMPWGRMFRKCIILPDTFNTPKEVHYGEDAIMNSRIAFNTKKDVSIIEKALYIYRQNNEGVCKNFSYSHSYENLLREYMLKAIPENELAKHYNDFVWRRLWLWRELFNNSISRPEWYNTKFHKTLIEDIRNGQCTIGHSDWLLLKYGHPIMRFMIILARKIKNLFKRSICK